jgi:hypothetical protein
MGTYAVDGKRQNMVATGIVEPVMEWVEVGGKRRPGDVQSRDEHTGMPQWSVEVIFRSESWGRASTATAMVSVGSMGAPKVEPFAPLVFSGLRVSVSVSKGGGLSERWDADHIEDAKAGAAKAA